MKASAQRSDIREGTGRVKVFGKFNSDFLLNANDNLGKKSYLKYIVNGVARILPDHVN